MVIFVERIIGMQQENKMGTMSTGKLLITMAAPMMLSMLVQALYNIVDSIFVAQYSQDALTAVSLTFPVQSLMISIAAGTGVGVNSVLSRRLGEKQFGLANRVATHGLVVGVLSSLLVAVIGFFLSGRFFAFFTNTPATIQMGKEYMLVCTVFSMGIFLEIIGERLLQATGKTNLSMIAQMTGAVINIILDPIFIFGFAGIPSMGAMGAAIATVIGQWAAALVAIILNVKYNKEISLSFKGFRMEKRIIQDIYRVGVPAIIMQSITSIMTVGMNKILGDDIAISIFGIYFKINSFIFMPVFGLSNALIPIFAYNYGAKKVERIKSTMRHGLSISISMMVIGTAVLMIFPEFFLKMFKAEGNMMKMGVDALRIIPIGFSFAGYCIVAISLLQAIDSAGVSIIISVTRQLAVILPVAFLLKMLWGFPAVWAALPIAEIVATVLCVIFYKKICLKKIHALEE